MLMVGQELVLGEKEGYIQVFDIKKLEFSHTKQFIEIGHMMCDMIVIKDSHQLLMAGAKGLLKATKDQAIKHSFQGKFALSICHIIESLYLVGFMDYGLIVWNEQTDEKLFQICQDRVDSIKRILTTNTYFIKTYKNGLMSLTIKNLKDSQFSLEHFIEEKDEKDVGHTDSLQISYVDNSHLVIATTHNEKVEWNKFKRSILVMKVNIASIRGQ